MLTRSTDLLIAPPAFPDHRFDQAVIMLTHQQHGGTFALCLNRTTEHTLADIADEIGIDSQLQNWPLYWGGPMSSGTIWLLHSAEWCIDSTVELNTEWSMTSNRAMFHHLADGDVPRESRLMYGYCSWLPGQLQAELEGHPPRTHRHSWLVAQNPGIDWVFNQPVENLWQACTELSAQQAVSAWL